MDGGYILDFSNRTFEEFVAESVGLEIYAEQYQHGSGSKANRLRGFWKVETNANVAKLIRDLVEYAQFINKDSDPKLVSACIAIADRLAASSHSMAATLPRSDSSSVSGQSSEQRTRVFISYSWDSDAHKDWVREFADALATNGIDIILDQYDLRPGEDRFQFMEASVRDADAVLCVCTPKYVSKANSRDSGVGVETSLITPQYYQRMSSAKQFIPIIRNSDELGTTTPDYLAALIFVDFRDDSAFNTQMEHLLRHLHKQPKFRKPSVGPKPKFE